MNENIVLKKPYLKKNTYISELHQEIIFKFSNINIKNIEKCKDYYLIQLYLNNAEDLNNINNIDSIILTKYIKKNKKWFNNDLTNDDINTIFIDSYCKHNNTIDIILNDSTSIIKNNKTVELDNDIISQLKNKDINIDIEVKILGIYISKKQIQIKWIISKIIMDVHMDNMELDKEELEIEWTDTYNETVIFLDNKKLEYTKRMNNIEIFKEKNLELLNEIKKTSEKKYWNQKINILKNNIKNILSINDNR